MKNISALPIPDRVCLCCLLMNPALKSQQRKKKREVVSHLLQLEESMWRQRCQRPANKKKKNPKHFKKFIINNYCKTAFSRIPTKYNLINFKMQLIFKKNSPPRKFWTQQSLEESGKWKRMQLQVWLGTFWTQHWNEVLCKQTWPYQKTQNHSLSLPHQVCSTLTQLSKPTSKMQKNLSNLSFMEIISLS